MKKTNSLNEICDTVAFIDFSPSATTALIFQRLVLFVPTLFPAWLIILGLPFVSTGSRRQVSRPFWSHGFLLGFHVMRQRIRKESLGNKFTLLRSASSSSGLDPVSLRTEIRFLGDWLKTEE